MEIIQERLEREFNLNLITTTPNVIYEVLMRDGTTIKINTPSQMPSTGDIDKILIVLGLSEQRRGAPDAQKLYQETPESIQRREKVSAERKAFFSSTPKSVRPTKKQRRQIHQFLEK